MMKPGRMENVVRSMSSILSCPLTIKVRHVSLHVLRRLCALMQGLRSLSEASADLFRDKMMCHYMLELYTLYLYFIHCIVCPYNEIYFIDCTCTYNAPGFSLTLDPKPNLKTYQHFFLRH